MQLASRFINFYINSSVHVALAVCSLVCITFIECNININYPFLIFVFFATITGYSFVKYFELVKRNYTDLTNELKSILLFSALSFIVLISFSLFLTYRALISFVAMAMITIFYTTPFLSKPFFFSNIKTLRTIKGIKIYVIAFVWTVVTVIIPLINEKYAMVQDVILIVLQRYLFVLVITLPFEIRDMNFDDISLSTIPQKLGLRLTKCLGIILLIIIVLMNFFKTLTFPCQRYSLALIITVVSALLVYSKKVQSKYYSSFFVESVPILWLILILLCDFFS